MRPTHGVLDALSGLDEVGQLAAAQDRIAARVPAFQEALRSGKIPTIQQWTGRKEIADPTQHELFNADPVAVVNSGFADADDLAAWRAAELMNAGQQVSIRVVLGVKPRGAFVLLIFPDGSIEKPSAKASAVAGLLPAKRD